MICSYCIHAPAGDGGEGFVEAGEGNEEAGSASAEREYGQRLKEAYPMNSENRDRRPFLCAHPSFYVDEEEGHGARRKGAG